jgi:flagellar hook-associated protein 2
VFSKPFTITTTATTTGTDLLNDLKSATNDDKQSILNYVDINYSELTKKISITNKQTGDTSTLKIEDVSGTVATDLGLTTTGTATGLNAIVDFKTLDDVDMAVDKNFNSNSFTSCGMKFDLLKTGDQCKFKPGRYCFQLLGIKKFV